MGMAHIGIWASAKTQNARNPKVLDRAALKAHKATDKAEAASVKAKSGEGSHKLAASEHNAAAMHHEGAANAFGRAAVYAQRSRDREKSTDMAVLEHSHRESAREHATAAKEHESHNDDYTRDELGRFAGK